MPENQPTVITPEQIVTYNQAFATSLTALNTVIANQRNEIMAMVFLGLDAMIAIAKKTQSSEEAISKLQTAASKLKDDAEKATQAVAASTNDVTPSPSAESISSADNWYNEILHTLNLAQNNVVSVQNNLSILGQAALTQVIQTATTVITAADAKSLAS